MVRERLAVVPDELPAALDLIRGQVAEGFILSTCNRVEVYALAARSDEAARAARAALLARNARTEELASRLYLHADDDALQHLFRVASGLDSVIPGETEILGQVRFALQAARRAGLVGGVLSQVGAAALSCGKRVRASTGIARQALSVVSVGLGEVARELGGWSGRHVMVVGAGNIAQLALKHLTRERDLRITLVGRTMARAMVVAARFEIEARPVGELKQVLAAADAVVTCTAAPHCVVGAHDVVQAGRAHGDRPLVCLDLGVPRDVEPAVGALPAVTLIDLEHVQRISDRHRAERTRELAKAHVVVQAELERFRESWRARDVIPAIARLRIAADTIIEAELTRALAKLPDLTPREQRVVRTLARRLAGKLLHSPTVALRESGDPALADATRRLFSRL